MSDEPKPAMRKGDYLKADISQFLNVVFDLVKQAVTFSKWGVRVAAIIGAPETGGLSIVVGFIASEILDQAFEAASDWAIEEVSHAFARGPTPSILEGSPNVFFNKLEAARGGPSGDNTTQQKIMQGSQWVFTNQRPAAREDDRTRSSGFCVLMPDGPGPNIFIGGPPIAYDNRPELGKEVGALLFLADNFSTLKGLRKKLANLSMQAKQLKNAYNNGGLVARRSAKLGKDAYEVGHSVWGMVK